MSSSILGGSIALRIQIGPNLAGTSSASPATNQQTASQTDKTQCITHLRCRQKSYLLTNPGKL